jgi:hypothetical protein
MNLGPDTVRPATNLPCLTRRRFVRTVAGAAAVGGALEFGLFKPGFAAPKTHSFAPVPIPGGTPNLNGVYHVFGPSVGGDPTDAEPSTITNFNGFVGLAFINGMVTRTDTATGETLHLPFLNSDMRFMMGEFRGADGRVHQGTFALV